MSQLTRQGVKTLAESSNITTEKSMILQILDLTVFEEADMKKSIKARMHLSDGVSRLTCMIGDKVFSTFTFKPQKFDVVNIIIGNSQLQMVSKRPVLILKQAPELIASGLDQAIGAPEDYNKNLDNNRFPTDVDVSVPAKR